MTTLSCVSLDVVLMNNDAAWTCPVDDCGLVLENFAEFNEHLVDHIEDDVQAIVNDDQFLIQPEGFLAAMDHEYSALLGVPVKCVLEGTELKIMAQLPPQEFIEITITRPKED